MTSTNDPVNSSMPQKFLLSGHKKTTSISQKRELKFKIVVVSYFKTSIRNIRMISANDNVVDKTSGPQGMNGIDQGWHRSIAPRNAS